MENQGLTDIEEILKFLPHRHPFVLVDRITSIVPGTSVTGIKNITYNEWYFQGLPAMLRIVPALILCESVAQLGSMVMLMEGGNNGKLIFFSGIEKVRFRRPVRAGDQLILKAAVLRRKSRIGRFTVEGKVNDQIAFDGIMRFAMEGGES